MFFVHAAAGSVSYADDLADDGRCLSGRAHRQSANREVGNAVTVAVDEPVVRGGLELHLGHVDEAGRNEIAEAEGGIVARIEGRIAGEHDVARRHGPRRPCPGDEVFQRPRRSHAEAELVVDVVDRHDRGLVALRCSMGDERCDLRREAGMRDDQVVERLPGGVQRRRLIRQDEKRRLDREIGEGEQRPRAAARSLRVD